MLVKPWSEAHSALVLWATGILSDPLVSISLHFAGPIQPPAEWAMLIFNEAYGILLAYSGLLANNFLPGAPPVPYVAQAIVAPVMFASAAMAWHHAAMRITSPNAANSTIDRVQPGVWVATLSLAYPGAVQADIPLYKR